MNCHLSNSRGGGNKRDGCAKVPELIKKSGGINPGGGWDFLGKRGGSTST